MKDEPKKDKPHRSYDVHEVDRAIKRRPGGDSTFVDWRTVSTLPRSRGRKVQIPPYFKEYIEEDETKKKGFFLLISNGAVKKLKQRFGNSLGTHLFHRTKDAMKTETSQLLQEKRESQKTRRKVMKDESEKDIQQKRSYDIYEKDQAIKRRPGRDSTFVDWRTVSTLKRSRGRKFHIPTYFYDKK